MQKCQHWLNQLTMSDNQLGLSILALAAGIAAALVITLFRLAIEWPLEIFLPMSSEDDYEALAQLTRIGLLVTGGLLLVAIFQPLKPEQRSVGVTHVLIRMERHQGYMPKTNLLLQWVAAAIARRSAVRNRSRRCPIRSSNTRLQGLRRCTNRCSKCRRTNRRT